MNLDKALADGDQVQVKTGCYDGAIKALNAAFAAEEAGQSLDALYASGGLMAAPDTCYAEIIVPGETAAAPAAPAPDQFVAAAAEAEAVADTATCKARTKADVPSVPDAGLTSKPEPADGDALWKAIGAYASGLGDLSNTTNSTALTTATSGIASAIQSAGASLKNNAFSPAVSLLFLVFDKAVEQDRYETLKTAVVCANPLFIRWRSVLRDTLRLEQIAAFETEAKLFEEDAARLQAAYGPDPDPAHDCHPSGSTAWIMTGGCATVRARDTVASTTASASDIFTAHLYLAERATALLPRLTAVQAEAASANSLAKGDPVPAVDAFIQAHRALRAAILANDGQFSALESSVDDLAKATSTLQSALAPAAKASSKK
jgi:hypothetical protein